MNVLRTDPGVHACETRKLPNLSEVWLVTGTFKGIGSYKIAMFDNFEAADDWAKDAKIRYEFDEVQTELIQLTNEPLLFQNGNLLALLEARGGSRYE